MMDGKIRISRRGCLKTGVALGVTGAGSALLTTAPFGSAHADSQDLPARPFVNTMELGSFRVTTVFDGAIQLDGPHPIFGMDQSAESVQELAEANFLPADRMEIGFTPTVVESGEDVILFDAGNGAGRRPAAGALVERLKLAGINPEDVTIVVITHMHPDHIGGLMEEGVPAFPNARYLTASAEYDFWSADDKLTGATERVATLVQSNVVPLAEKFSFISPGESVVSGIEAIGAFGHTPGHMAYNLESEGQRLVITADTANHFVISLQKPDWEVRFDMDKKAAAKTRRELFGMIAADKVPFIGYHMPFPSVGYIETIEGGFRYVPASYQLYL